MRSSRSCSGGSVLSLSSQRTRWSTVSQTADGESAGGADEVSSGGGVSDMARLCPCPVAYAPSVDEPPYVKPGMCTASGETPTTNRSAYELPCTNSPCTTPVLLLAGGKGNAADGR